LVREKLASGVVVSATKVAPNEEMEDEEEEMPPVDDL
jgi:hypothetical protein